MKSHSILVIFGLLFFLAQFPIQAEQMAEWHKAEKEVGEVLSKENGSMASLVKKSENAKPSNAQEAMFQINLFMRAGMDEKTLDALRLLRKFPIKNYQGSLEEIYYSSCGTYKSLRVAQGIMEIFANEVSSQSLNGLLELFREAGWSDDKIDQWLIAKPKTDFWLSNRLIFEYRRGYGDAVFKELSDEVRAHPEDVRKAVSFLYLCGDARVQPRDVAWIAEVIQPKRAIDAYKLGSCPIFRHSKIACDYFLQALQTPLTNEERNEVRFDVVRLSVQPENVVAGIALPSQDLWKVAFGVRVRRELAEHLLALSRKEEAQKVMLEAHEMLKKNGLPLDMYFAGQIQGGTGARVVEGEIKKAETESENDPSYWVKRYDYYFGRREEQLAKEALQKGLAITDPMKNPKVYEDKNLDGIRALFLHQYMNILSLYSDEKGIREAYSLYHHELEIAAPESQSGGVAARAILESYDVSADDPVLWKWISSQTHLDGPLLAKMLCAAKPEKLESYLLRAEKLANEGDASRCFEMGKILNGMDMPSRALPFLKTTLQRVPDNNNHMRDDVRIELIKSYKKMRDWKHAEEELILRRGIFLTEEYFIREYIGLAVDAAKSGDKEECMRMWKSITKFNARAGLEHIRSMVEFDMWREMVEYYEQLQKELPDSTVPAQALAKLR